MTEVAVLPLMNYCRPLSLLFALGVYDAFTNFNRRLRVGGGVWRHCDVDDNYGIGPPLELFAANTQFAILNLNSSTVKSRMLH